MMLIFSLYSRIIEPSVLSLYSMYSSLMSGIPNKLRELNSPMGFHHLLVPHTSLSHGVTKL